MRQQQEEWLLSCIKRNTCSEYGRTYGFDKITSIEAYQKCVPLVSYEDISGFIEEIAKGSNDLLFAGEPVAFEVTGGSTSGGKLIPYTKESFDDFQRAILPWLVQTLYYYGIGEGSIYWSISPAMRKISTTPQGIPIGVSDTAYLGEDIGSTVANNMAVPLWVAELNDLSQWQVATLYWLICSKELEFISVWSPTFLLMLLDALHQHSEVLKELLSKGGEINGHCLTSDLKALNRLNRYLEESDTLLLWTNLKLISCWEDAMSKPYALKLRTLFPYVAFQPKGLISTESVVTIPDVEGAPLLSVKSGFYEFLDEKKTVHLGDELHLNKVYEVIITTSGGLYRYCSGDMVCYEGMKDALPILRFIGRKGTVSDMVGEKLSEAFVQQAMEEVEGFTMLVAQAEGIPNYLLLGESENIESFSEQVEEKLLKNPQYAYARKVGQLGKLECAILNDIMRSFIEYKSKNGSRVGDIKVPVLVTDQKWLEKIRSEIA